MINPREPIEEYSACEECGAEIGQSCKYLGNEYPDGWLESFDAVRTVGEDIWPHKDRCNKWIEEIYNKKEPDQESDICG